MPIEYRSVAHADHVALVGLMRQLYEEDPAERPVPAENFARTLREFETRPEKGTVLVIDRDGEVVGYAILINFWSNECGGNVIIIDELYVAQSCRRQGIGSDFVRHLIDNEWNNAVAVRLEVTPTNARARRLYERLGFSSHKNETMQLRLS
jgi:ribosomal protein S18 acetylase RimI-like enzyme